MMQSTKLAEFHPKWLENSFRYLFFIIKSFMLFGKVIWTRNDSDAHNCAAFKGTRKIRVSAAHLPSCRARPPPPSLISPNFNVASATCVTRLVCGQAWAQVTLPRMERRLFSSCNRLLRRSVSWRRRRAFDRGTRGTKRDEATSYKWIIESVT